MGLRARRTSRPFVQSLDEGSMGISGHKTSRPLWQLDLRDNSTYETTRPLWQLDPCDNLTHKNLTNETTRPSWQLDPLDNSTLVTTRPSWQLDPRDNSTLVTTRPSWQLDPRDNSTLVTTPPSWQLHPRDNSTLVTTPPSWQLHPRDNSTHKNLTNETTRPFVTTPPPLFCSRCRKGWCSQIDFLLNESGINPNSLDNKDSCWILLDFYCLVTMLRELTWMKKGWNLPGRDACPTHSPNSVVILMAFSQHFRFHRIITHFSK